MPRALDCQRKLLLRALLALGVLYWEAMLLWYNSQLAGVQLDNGVGKTFRPRLGELEVVPVTRKPLPARKKQRPMLILSPQGRVAVRKREDELRRNATQESEDPEVVQARKESAQLEEAESHAKTVRNFPRGETKPRKLHCVGWKATAECSPNGPRVPAQDHSCSTRVPFGASGYCEVEDVDSGEQFRVGRRFCNSVKAEAVFRCSDAPGFANFPALAVEALKKVSEPGFRLPSAVESATNPQDGIVMVIYPKMMASAYATIRVLRDLGCKLPLELWFVPREMRNHPADMKTLQDLAGTDGMGVISFHEVTDFHATKFRVKVHAIYNSHFNRVLFLDADNVPVRDPRFLFDLREFKETGAVFWPGTHRIPSSIFIANR
ncbi:unnamed protein product [Phytophthora fragariaefolia]|uniref:Unnamed protein product n=1 Tax=Phytophthora fragariaefolia TaxID=1490495 RepID=A0A9W6WXR3_9STRA|nr:unnamed protein product [Phytophthora fragariaefolia]